MENDELIDIVWQTREIKKRFVENIILGYTVKLNWSPPRFKHLLRRFAKKCAMHKRKPYSPFSKNKFYGKYQS